MFYPVESLRKGGRFYLCWVADSWPLRFATITQRQLWSQDIRELCDDLLEVMTQESGFPSARFSLRLSSQLMRGLVRLYQRKVVTFLGDLCMLNATVTKQINKKYGHHEPTTTKDVQPRSPIIITELVDNEERVEERIQNSGNVVANIAEITLREAVIPEVTVTTDGFGEENPEQALALLNDRTLEQMLGHRDASLAQHSGDVPMLDVTEKSHDKSRLLACEVVMERISEVDLSMFRKSVAELMQNSDIEKEIPPIPEILIPDMPDVLPEKDKLEAPVQAPPQEPEPVAEKELELRLEELEEGGVPRRRRRVKRLLVDRHTKIAGAVLRERVENIMLELRCEDSTYDVIDHKRLPAARYLQRPACVGWRAHGHVAAPLLHMFTRNLTVAPVRREADVEAVLAGEMRRTRPLDITLDKIVEEADPGAAPQPATDAPGIPAWSSAQQTEMDELERTTAEIYGVPAKKRRGAFASFRQSQHQRASQGLLMRVEGPVVPQKKQEQRITTTPKRSQRGDRPIRSSGNLAQKRRAQDLTPTEISKERHSQDLSPTEISKEIDFPMQENLDKHQQEELHLSQLLEQAGLADGQMLVGREPESRMSQRKRTSDGSETPLGSLDRTAVDLGESVVSTDSQRFLRKEWGTQGTMLKIVKLLDRRVQPLTVGVLVAHGPVPAGQKRLVAARCFSSLLKLRKHSFINIKKDVETLEVMDISYGPKLRE